MLRNERGSGLIKIIVYLGVIAYIGLLVVRFATVSIRYKDVEVKIRETIRNSLECNREKILEEIYKVLDEKGIVPDEEVNVVCRGNRVGITFSYHEIFDGLFFKKKLFKRLEIEGVVG